MTLSSVYCYSIELCSAFYGSFYREFDTPTFSACSGFDTFYETFGNFVVAATKLD